MVGTAMAGYDGHRGWLYSAAVRGDHRRSGLGSSLVHHAERALAATGCMKINHNPKTGPYSGSRPEARVRTQRRRGGRALGREPFTTSTFAASRTSGTNCRATRRAWCAGGSALARKASSGC
jgi:GNAT superfamily N-acetyltransferase